MASGTTLADRLSWQHPEWTWEACVEAAERATAPSPTDATLDRPRRAEAEARALQATRERGA